jgi:hypothetical protein
VTHATDLFNIKTVITICTYVDIPAMDGDNFETNPDEAEGLQNIDQSPTGIRPVY